MDERILILELAGPMQSWGTRARWDVRDTGNEPTKSGVIGLLGCALGLERGSPRLEELDRQIRFGVRLDRPGVISTDYQTVTGYHRTAAGGFKHSDGTAATLKSALEHGPATVVSPRDYLHDAEFLVVIQGPRSVMDELESALRNPKWPLFLGRKSCIPVRPVLARAEDAYAGIEEALREHPRSQRSDRGPLVAYIEQSDGDLERQDALRVNGLRMYEFRRCRRLEVDPPCTSHD